MTGYSRFSIRIEKTFCYKNTKNREIGNQNEKELTLKINSLLIIRRLLFEELTPEKKKTWLLLFTFVETKNSITMKKILMIALMLCFSCIASPLLKSQTPPDDPAQILIIIEIKDEHPSGIPKSPAAVSLQAYFDCTTSEIVVTAQNAGGLYQCMRGESCQRRTIPSSHFW